jgi:hypothetical protein
MEAPMPEPKTFRELLEFFRGRHVRLTLTAGAHLDGRLVPYDDYVTFEGWSGGVPIAHVVSVVEVTPVRRTIPPDTIA